VCGNHTAVLVETTYYSLNTWNVLKLFQIAALSQFKLELEKYSSAVVADQESRWKGVRIIDTGNSTMYYSGSMDNNMFGTGFLVNKKYKYEVIGSELVNEGLYVLSVRGRFNNTTIIYAHAPTEGTGIPVSKDSFYDKLETVYHRVHAHDTKIIM
jgi:hypothetical protein